MVLRIRTRREEFIEGNSGGYVYGEIQRQKSFPVYVELGIEEEYTPSSQDNSKTEYRFFRNCIVSVAETNEQLDRGKYIYSLTDVTVVIYC